MNYPEDIHNYDNHPLSPFYDEKETECPTCGSSMTISSFDKDVLECDNEQCETTIDLSDSGMNDW